MRHKSRASKILAFAVLMVSCFWTISSLPTASAVTQQSGSTGLQGKVSAPPPSRGATIDIPHTGQSFSALPITVSGLCPNGTLVEIYKNGVFGGSADCKSGSYSLQIDLFNGRNDLVARVFDTLNQAGPDSNTVTVTYLSSISTGQPQLILTTQFAKRGADPGSILSWPITLSGGAAPYAISIDWGDSTPPDLISQKIPGDLNLQHTYTKSGIYKITIKVTDANGNSAFLQLVAIANGPVQQTANNNSAILTRQQTKILLLPIIVLSVLVFVAYWLGRRHQIEAIKNHLRKGEPPL